MDDTIFILMRWLHISSVAALIGGMIFGRVAMEGAAKGLSGEARENLLDQAAARYRPLLLAAMAALLISGTYNILTFSGQTPLYHMLLGVKLLLAMHVFAVAFLVSRPHNPRRGRMMAGAAISGLAIIAISASLRFFRL